MNIFEMPNKKQIGVMVGGALLASGEISGNKAYGETSDKTKIESPVKPDDDFFNLSKPTKNEHPNLNFGVTIKGSLGEDINKNAAETVEIKNSDDTRENSLENDPNFFRRDENGNMQRRRIGIKE